MHQFRHFYAGVAWGCGAWHVHSWFQMLWDSRAQPLSIAEKELIPIILALAAWGDTWSNCWIICHSDNQVVVACLRSLTSKCKGVMHLIRCLLLIEAQLQCYANYLADALSRNNLPMFLSKHPGAHPHPTPVSFLLWDLLLDSSANWISPHWNHQFNTIFKTA